MDQTGIVIVEHLNLTAIENTRRGKITRFITDGITFLAIFYVFEHNSPADFCITYLADNQLKERKLAFLTQFVHKFIIEKLLSHVKIRSLTDSSTLETIIKHNNSYKNTTTDVLNIPY